MQTKMLAIYSWCRITTDAWRELYCQDLSARACPEWQQRCDQTVFKGRYKASEWLNGHNNRCSCFWPISIRRPACCSHVPEHAGIVWLISHTLHFSLQCTLESYLPNLTTLSQNHFLPRQLLQHPSPSPTSSIQTIPPLWPYFWRLLPWFALAFLSLFIQWGCELE